LHLPAAALAMANERPGSVVLPRPAVDDALRALVRALARALAREHHRQRGEGGGAEASAEPGGGDREEA
jgi:Arc/MetJ family transcription regulator